MTENFKCNYRITIYLILLLFFAQSAYSQGKNFIWEVKTGSNTVYLLGSIHVGKADIYPLPDAITEAFNKSEFLAVEVNINEINLDGMAGDTDFLSELMYTDGTTFKDHISDSLYRKFQELFKKYSTPEMLVQKMKPNYIIMTMYQMLLMKSGYSAEYGVDMYFLNLADSIGMEIKELEDAKSQIDLLMGINEEEDSSETYLWYTIDELLGDAGAIDTLYNAWKRADLEKIDSLTHGIGIEQPEFEPVMKKLLDDRNLKMAEKAEEYLETGRVHFIIVGAAHLVGEMGVINLLKEKGIYEIKQL